MTSEGRLDENLHNCHKKFVRGVEIKFKMGERFFFFFNVVLGSKKTTLLAILEIIIKSLT